MKIQRKSNNKFRDRYNKKVALKHIMKSGLIFPKGEKKPINWRCGLLFNPCNNDFVFTQENAPIIILDDMEK